MSTFIVFLWFGWQIIPSIVSVFNILAEYIGCVYTIRANQQLDQAHLLRASTRKFPTTKCKVHPSTKRTTYPDTKWTVAFTENHHFIGVNKILYPRFEFILPSVIFDGRHFQGFSVCLRRASFNRRVVGVQRNHQVNHSKLLNKGTTIFCYTERKC